MVGDFGRFGKSKISVFINYGFHIRQITCALSHVEN